MNCEVQHLEKNIRYRILNINGEQYLLDMERSFWKVIFPFFFWMFPSPVFKVEDQEILEQLKGPKIGKADKSDVVSLGGLAYGLGILLVPLMYYFDISISRLISTVLIILAFVFVVLLNLSFRRKRKEKLYDVVELEALERGQLWIRPSSIKHLFKVSVIYFFLLGLVLLFSWGFIDLPNIILSITASILWFFLLSIIRITVEEGHTTVKFKK